MRAGGGIAHRLGLSDSILVFSQHAAFLGAGGVTDGITRLRRLQPERKVAVEVSTRQDALLAARAGADVIQVEKLAPAEFGEIVTEYRSLALAAPPLLAATGGVDETTRGRAS